MRKLTPAQLERVEKQRGLFDAAVWSDCIVCLHAMLSDDDPTNTEGWTTAMQLVKAFVEWCLQQAQSHRGLAAKECLQLASSKQMSAETLHELNEEPCIFSGRRYPKLYVTAQQRTPVAAAVRVQCRFQWWAHHESTGLECPHSSRVFVYESGFSHLVRGVYALGHLPQILKHHSKKMEKLSLVDFTAHPLWEELHQKINMILYVVYADSAQ